MLAKSRALYDDAGMWDTGSFVGDLGVIILTMGAFVALLVGIGWALERGGRALRGKRS